MDLITNINGMNPNQYYNKNKFQHKKVANKSSENENSNLNKTEGTANKSFKKDIINLQDDFTVAQDKFNILQMASETLGNISESLNDIRSIALENVNQLDNYDLSEEIKHKLDNVDKLNKIQNNVEIILGENDTNCSEIIAEFKNISAITTKLASIQGNNKGLGENLQLQKVLDEVNKTIESVSSTKTNLDKMKTDLISNIKTLSVTLENLVSSHGKIRSIELASQTLRITKKQILKEADKSISVQLQNNNIALENLIN